MVLAFAMFFIGGYFFGTVGYIGGFVNGVSDGRIAERQVDLELLYKKFNECGDDTACKDKFRYAYFELRHDQQTRDGRDALERIYKARPHLRPVEEKK